MNNTEKKSNFNSAKRERIFNKRLFIFKKL